MSLDLLVKQAAQSLVTSPSDVVHLLENAQSVMKRWVWEESARRKGADPARWLIDNEYHVQSVLWADLCATVRMQDGAKHIFRLHVASYQSSVSFR